MDVSSGTSDAAGAPARGPATAGIGAARAARCTSLSALPIGMALAAATVLTVAGWSMPRLASAQQSEARWPFEERFGRFVLHADFRVDQRKLPVRQELLILDRELTQLFQLRDTRGTIHVVLMQSEQAYRQYMQVYFPKVPYRRALFLRDRGPGMLFTYLHDHALEDLRHEATHAILNDGRQPLPLWLDEGLAEYFEPPADQRYRGNPYLGIIQPELRRGGITPIEQLATITNVVSMEDVHYRHSWAWVHFMIHRTPASRSLLADYVRQGYLDPEYDFAGALRSLFPDLEAQLQHHFAALATSPPEGPR